MTTRNSPRHLLGEQPNSILRFLALPQSCQFDHVVPYVAGGGREIDNIVASCRTCNRSKGSKDVDVWRAGWIS